MVTHEAWLTKLFNEYLVSLGIWLLALFNRKPDNPAEPWADFIVMQFLVAIILIALFADSAQPVVRGQARAQCSIFLS